ncbi:membrane protein [Streptomyces albireticuli]|uniref:Membrane protein n=2 Tax=Streptomyces albireticuli TaxID=1940 RepID=A0A1Z2L390_9ACTN|nr:membrane protein [Streptomyces albireticuli]
MREMSTGEAVVIVRWWSRGRIGRRSWRRVSGEAGMTTAEYAVGTLAACALAAVLYKVVTSGAVSAALQSLIGRALNAPF